MASVFIDNTIIQTMCKLIPFSFGKVHLTLVMKGNYFNVLLYIF